MGLSIKCYLFSALAASMIFVQQTFKADGAAMVTVIWSFDFFWNIQHAHADKATRVWFMARTANWLYNGAHAVKLVNLSIHPALRAPLLTLRARRGTN